MLLFRRGKFAMRFGFTILFFVVFATSANLAQTPNCSTADVVPGHIISKKPPQYPFRAKLAHLEGEVVVDAKIGKNGHVYAPTALTGPAILQKAAVDAVRDWVYTPFICGGEPVEVDTTFTASFKIPPKEKMPKGRVFVPGSVMEGLLITRVQPLYPEHQLSEHRSAEVALRVVIGPSGDVEDAFAINGYLDFQQAAIDSVMQWKYKPYIVKGKPVEVLTDATVTFGVLAQ
jgi:TonB family protein